jgi:mannose-6-phosphate isomerase-like protein (cupin superfamily)
MKFAINEFLGKLPLPANEKWKDGVWDVEPFKKGNVTLVFFAPRGKDYQTFHEEDEFYFIARGKAELVVEDERFSCETGDCFFVPAQKKHHFENISDDFATWAIFFK